MSLRLLSFVLILTLPSGPVVGMAVKPDDAANIVCEITGLPVEPRTSGLGRCRWLSEDPFGEEGGVNLYAYVANGPIDAWDPLGLEMPPTEAGRWEFVKWRFTREGFVDLLLDRSNPNARGGCTFDAMPGFSIGDLAGGAAKAPYSFGQLRKAHESVLEKLGVQSLAKGRPGKFGSPQRGTPQKGCRLDPAHPSAKPGTPEAGPHINFWDWLKGKRGSGGNSGAVPIE